MTGPISPNKEITEKKITDAEARRRKREKEKERASDPAPSI